jgi:UMF1 family MFS transporter
MEKERKQSQLAWYLYDFGNSAYAAVVLLAIYLAYFKGTVVGAAKGTETYPWADKIEGQVKGVVR